MITPDLHVWVSTYYSGNEILRNHVGVRTQAIRGPVETFIENAKRVLRLAAFPVATYVAGKRFQMAECAALLEITGAPFLGKFSDQVVPTSVARLRDEILDGVADSPVPREFCNPSEREQVLAYGEYGTEIVVDVLIPMQLSLAWTITETLIHDLWKAAVASKPSITPMDNNGNPRNYYFARFNIRRRDGVHAAYADAFNNTAIDAAVAHVGLRSVSVLRNVIVHKAGVCDDVYRTESSGLQWLPQCRTGDKIKITGQQAHNLMVEVMKAAFTLVMEVDTWLINHP